MLENGDLIFVKDLSDMGQAIQASTGVKKRAENLLGSPYNASFYPDGDGYYCSQFIAELLPIFETIPMKFGEGEQEISSFWEDYYRELGLAVPLDQPGTNPSLLAQSPQLQFKERYLDDYNH